MCACFLCIDYITTSLMGCVLTTLCQVMTVVVLALFWVIYSRYLLPMADRLEQAGPITSLP